MSFAKYMDQIAADRRAAELTPAELTPAELGEQAVRQEINEAAHNAFINIGENND